MTTERSLSLSLSQKKKEALERNNNGNEARSKEERPAFVLFLIPLTHILIALKTRRHRGIVADVRAIKPGCYP